MKNSNFYKISCVFAHSISIKYIDIFLVGFLICTTSCKEREKDVNIAPKPTNNKQITGKILLPTGSTINPNELKVINCVNEVAVVDNKYTIDTTGRFSINYAVDIYDNIIMMKYNYPNQSDHDFSSKSSALALIMSSPMLVSLTDYGKNDMINKIFQDPNFEILVEEVDKVIISGKSITDTTNKSLIARLSHSSNTLSMRTAGYFRPKPLIMNRAGKVVLIKNNYVAHNYALGVYKDDVRVSSKIITGTTMFAESFKDIILGIFDSYSDPDEYYFTMYGDGKYEFKARSGKLGENDNSEEFERAQKENIKHFIIRQIASLIDLKDGADCEETNIKTIVEQSFNYEMFQNAKTNAQISGAIFEITFSVLDNSDKIISNCTNIKNPPLLKKVFKLTNKVLKFLDPIGKTSQGLNISAHVFDFINSKPAIDTCFEVKGNIVIPCGDKIPTGKAVFTSDQFGSPLPFKQTINVNNSKYAIIDLTVNGIEETGEIFILYQKENDPLSIWTIQPSGSQLPYIIEGINVDSTINSGFYRPTSNGRDKGTYIIPSNINTGWNLKIPIELRNDSSAISDTFVLWVSKSSGTGAFDNPNKNLAYGVFEFVFKY